jgi:hypothetical protein
MAKELRTLLRTLRRQGLRIERRGVHYFVYPPDQRQPAVLLGGSGKARSVPNARAQLRRSGISC